MVGAKRNFHYGIYSGDEDGRLSTNISIEGYIRDDEAISEGDKALLRAKLEDCFCETRTWLEEHLSKTPVGN